MLLAPMLLVLTAYTSTTTDGLLAGAATRIVTPQRPAYLAGLHSPRLSDGVHDDLYARAVALSQGETTVIVVGVDIIGYARARVEDIKVELTRRGVPADGLVVCALDLLLIRILGITQGLPCGELATHRRADEEIRLLLA